MGKTDAVSGEKVDNLSCLIALMSQCEERFLGVEISSYVVPWCSHKRSMACRGFEGNLDKRVEMNRENGYIRGMLHS